MYLISCNHNARQKFLLSQALRASLDVTDCRFRPQASGVYNPAKLMGVTTLDVARAKTFVAENQGRSVFSFCVNSPPDTELFNR